MTNKAIYLVRKVAVPLISITVFMYDIVIILGSQYLWIHLLPVNIRTLQYLLDSSKRAFIDLLATILEIIAPSQVRITTDNASVPKESFKVDPKSKTITSHLEKHSISISNHQIYTDWIFLWWVAYTSKLGGRVYIMLKKSLESVPLLGYGMKNYRFIFMSRKWLHDRVTLVNRLGEIDADARGQGPLQDKKPVSIDGMGCAEWPMSNDNSEALSWPYNLILFPEGTNFTDNTKGKSRAYGAKVGKVPFEHALLPHTTGLRQSILSLRPSLDIVYDITMGYSGVAAGEYAESAYGLKSIFLESKYPKLVDIHIRAFNVEDIPDDNEEEFDNWLYKVWKEKDDLLARYYREGTFFFDQDLQHSVVGDFKVSRLEFFIVLLVPSLVTFFFLKFILSFIF